MSKTSPLPDIEREARAMDAILDVRHFLRRLHAICQAGVVVSAEWRHYVRESADLAAQCHQMLTDSAVQVGELGALVEPLKKGGGA